MRLPFLVTMILAIATTAGFAAELPPGVASKLAAQQAAAEQSLRSSAKGGKTAPSGQARVATRVMGTAGPIAISSVSVAAPANPATVPRFSVVELLVTIPTLTATKPYDPDPAAGGLNLGATFSGPSGSRSVSGYWDGTDWRIRFAPDAIGAWAFSVSASDSSGTANWNGGAFTCVTSANPGFIRVNGKALTFSGSNTNFVGVGHNTGWMVQVEHPAISGETPATAAYGTVPATSLLAATRAMNVNGENLLSFWLTTPWESPTGSFAQRAPIEALATGLGNYNQAPCQYLDQLFAKAAAAGVYLLPAIWPHDSLRGSQSPWGAASWNNNAYSSLCSAAEFVNTTAVGGGDTPQWASQKKFYRYLTARYGASTALAGWVGLVEINGTDAWAVNQTQARAWCSAVGSFFATQDGFRTLGGAFPITFHGTGASLATLDVSPLRANDAYDQQTSNVGVANDIGSQTLTLGNNDKPHFHSEFGGNIAAGATQPTHLHNGLWAGIAAGANITPLLWTDGQNFPRLTDTGSGAAMQDHLRWSAQFLAGTPWAGHPSLTSSVITTTSTRAWCSRLTDRGYGWAYNTSGAAIGSRTLTTTATAGSYQVWWFNPHADCSAPTVTSIVNVASSTLSLSIPVALQSSTDVAWRFQRRPPVTGSLSANLVAGVPGLITLGTSGNGIYSATITSLPTHVTLYQTADGVTLGAPITSVPTTISGLYLRVLGVADNLVASDSFQLTINEGAASSDPLTMNLAIAQVNHAPVFAKGANQLLVEDAGAQTVTGWASGISAGNGDPAQTLDFLVYTPDSALFSVQPTIAANGTLSFTAAANAFGAATVSVWLHDNGGTANGGADTSAEQVFTISVLPVNDMPVFTKGADVTVRENSWQYTNPNWLAWLSPGAANESDTITWIISNDNPGLFSVQPQITNFSALSFTPAFSAFGTATVTLRVQDDGGTANGGVDTSPPQTFTITITPVNDPPAFTMAAALWSFEDEPAQSLAWATGITAGPGEISQILDFIVTTTHPELFSTAPAISPAGILTFTPAANAVGLAVVTVVLHDDGGTLDNGVDATTRTFNLILAPVNDAPAFTKGADQNVIAGSGFASVPGWATGLSAGPADEAAQVLDFTVTNDHPELFTTPPFINASGTLVFEPASGVTGTATVSVAVHDNGGVDNGGVDLSAIQTFSVTVGAPANQTPVATPQTLATNEDVPLALTLTGTDAENQALTFTVVTGPTFGVLSGVSPNLIYTPFSNVSGNDSLVITANDGVLTSASATITITVTAVNDAPVATDQSVSTYQNRAVAITLVVSDIDTAAGSLVFSRSSPAHGTLSGSAPNLTYTPTAGYSGADSFTFSATDGQLASNTATVSISVSPLFEAHINFQPKNSPIPAGYQKDDGAIYAARGNGLTYGWNTANGDTTRDRNASNSLDQRYDTIIHTQKSSAATRWDIAVPNGSYDVVMVCGDPSFFDSIFRLNLEGVLVVSGTPTTTSRWVSGTARVVVSDGKLTISNGAGAKNNKLCFIDLIQVPPGVAN